jgi:hypothetical protein
MKRLSLKQLGFCFAVSLVGCNIEVGNPDDEPHGQSRLTLSLSAKQACRTISGDCTAVPVILPDSGANLTYEMSSIHLQLAGVTLQPGGEQILGSDIDLLAGSFVQLNLDESQAQGSGASLRFSATKQAPTFVLSGNLTGVVNGQLVSLPLSIEFSDPVLASLPVPGTNADLAGVLFDANVWFDFSDSKPDSEQLLKGLTSAACRDADSKSCAQQRLVLSRRVADRIARSVSPKMGAAPGKSLKSRQK